MNGAKIQLSPAEERLMANAEILLTKNKVLQKIKAMLEGVQEQMLAHAHSFSKPHVFETTPKISRGENYLGLPYFVLDYPRIFNQTDVFAVRSFFWWGRFFSSTLQLNGNFKSVALPKIEAAFSTFSKHHIGINSDPWQHHFELDNYKPVAELRQEDFKKLLHQQPHLKLATKLPIADWQHASAFLVDNWKFYLDTIL